MAHHNVLYRVWTNAHLKASAERLGLPESAWNNFCFAALGRVGKAYTAFPNGNVLLTLILAAIIAALFVWSAPFPMVVALEVIGM